MWSSTPVTAAPRFSDPAERLMMQHPHWQPNPDRAGHRRWVYTDENNTKHTIGCGTGGHSKDEAAWDFTNLRQRLRRCEGGACQHGAPVDTMGEHLTPEEEAMLQQQEYQRPAVYHPGAQVMFNGQPHTVGSYEPELGLYELYSHSGQPDSAEHEQLEPMDDSMQAVAAVEDRVTRSDKELCVMVPIPRHAGKQIHNWVKEQPWPEGTELHHPSKYHITLMYTPQGHAEHKDAFWLDHLDHAPVKAAGMSSFGPDEDGHAYVMKLDAPELSEHANLLQTRAEAFGLPITHFPGGYKPHITVAYGPTKLPESIGGDLPPFDFDVGPSVISPPRPSETPSEPVREGSKRVAWWRWVNQERQPNPYDKLTGPTDETHPLAGGANWYWEPEDERSLDQVVQPAQSPAEIPPILHAAGYPTDELTVLAAVQTWDIQSNGKFDTQDKELSYPLGQSEEEDEYSNTVPTQVNNPEDHWPENGPLPPDKHHDVQIGDDWAIRHSATSIGEQVTLPDGSAGVVVNVIPVGGQLDPWRSQEMAQEETLVVRPLHSTQHIYMPARLAARRPQPWSPEANMQGKGFELPISKRVVHWLDDPEDWDSPGHIDMMRAFGWDPDHGGAAQYMQANPFYINPTGEIHPAEPNYDPQAFQRIVDQEPNFWMTEPNYNPGKLGKLDRAPAAW